VKLSCKGNVISKMLLINGERKTVLLTSAIIILSVFLLIWIYFESVWNLSPLRFLNNNNNCANNNNNCNNNNNNNNSNLINSLNNDSLLRILCYGDSLTAGQNRGQKFWPYSINLQKTLEDSGS
jgi:hypothetical protein